MKSIFILHILVILQLALAAIVFAQVDTAWVRRYNGSGNGFDANTPYGPCLAIDNSGNIYVTGTAYVTGQGQNFILIKYDQDGNQLWTTSYNGPANGNDTARAITTDADGNVYITGPSDGIGTGSDYAVIKYNSAGDTQWVRRYNGSGDSNDIARQIKVDNLGNVYVTGFSIGIGSGEDFATVKYNASGVQQWVARYNRLNRDDRAFTLAIDNSYNIYVGGFSNNGVNQDFTLIKYDSLGNQVWIRAYNGTANGTDEIKAMVLDENGNIYVTGNSWGIDFDIMTIKYNTTGSVLWQDRYDYANDYDKATDMTIDDSGYVYVTGRSVGNGTDRDYILIKYNPNNGDTIWVRRYNNSVNSYDGAYAVAVDRLGNAYITGKSIGTGTGYDYATVKYNLEGNEEWIIRYNGTANDSDRAYSIAVDSLGDVYVTGESYNGVTNFDIVTIKYLGIPNIQEIRKEMKNSRWLIYPNPTISSYCIIGDRVEQVKIFDRAGNLVHKTWAIKDNFVKRLNPGIYFLQIKTKDNIYLAKLVKIQ